VAGYAETFEAALRSAPLQPVTAPASFFTKLVAAIQRLIGTRQ
jgi:hypothetical protein